MGEKGTIDTSVFPEMYDCIREMARYMELWIDQLNEQKMNLMQCWVGRGRNEFEVTYKILLRRFQDGVDVTWDLYEELLKAEEQLIQADLDYKKESYTE